MIKKLPLISTTLTAALAGLLMMGNVWAQTNGNGTEPPAGTTTEALVLDGGWQAFNWGAGEPVDASPEFTLSGAACISVVDAFNPGDQFSVFDDGTQIGNSFAPVLTQGGGEYPGWTSDADVAFADDNYSRGSFEVGAGDHQFRVSVINNPFNSGTAYIRADSDTANCDVATSPSQSRATFSVTKIFADGNDEAEITVSIDCNTGLILDQDKLLSNGESVEFVVTSFTPGAMNCTITEDGQAGYDGEYNNISLGEINDESCAYETIGGTAAFSCEITNTASPVDIVINKVWVIEGSISASGIDQGFGLDLYCQSAGMTGPGAHNDGGNSWHGYDNGEGDETFTWQIVPLFPSSSCYVEEYSLDSYVEVDNPCGNLVASVGNGAECTITNTVFFEGIPTLSQYGMAILALLMLGVGFVSFRRFS